MLIKPQTLDFTDFCSIFWYNDCKDFDENKSFFLQFFTDFEHIGAKTMYKPIDKLQHSFLDFNQPLGLHMNPDNRWIKLADRIPWDTFEVKYAELFPSDTGNVAKPLRMALGALIIQTKFQYSDRELVEQIAENPYLQYFIGLPGFREEAPFDASTLVLFRKRISAEMLMEVNEYLLAHKDDDKDDHTPPSGGKPMMMVLQKKIHTKER